MFMRINFDLIIIKTLFYCANKVSYKIERTSHQGGLYEYKNWY